jgi:hypothetical protein
MAEQSLGMNRLFGSIPGSAEATGLPNGSVELVTAFQAFHWFHRQQNGIVEFEYRSLSYLGKMTQ